MSGQREPTPEQAAAVAAREVDVFLQAGAGTGKTSVLVDRFCASVVEDGLGIEEVLAFTFTERAAEELRARIRRRLGTAADAAWIGTIHGFCRRLLAAHPAAAGLDPRFRVLEAPEAERLAARAFERSIDESLTAENGEVTAELLAAVRDRGLRSIVQTAHDELRSRGEAEPELPELEPGDPATAVADLGRAAEAALAECAADAKKGSEPLLAQLERARELAAAAGAGGDGGGALPSIEEVAPLELKTNAQAFQGECAARYRDAQQAARRALAEIELGWAYGSLRELVSSFGRHYADLKRERSGLDFEDLQLRTVALLVQSTAIRDIYRGRFKQIMVDEFQDTNAVQLALLRQLQGPESRLFCVGDEFQSIYGFRHADLEVFRAERRRFETLPDDRGRSLTLTGNFRSDTPVLGAVNALGNALLDGFLPLAIGSEEQIKTGPGQTESEAEPAVELLLTAERGWEADEVELRTSDDEPSPHSRVAEARLLAARLKNLCDTSETRASDIVVLLRAFTHVAAFEQALDGAGLSPYVVGGRGYWSQQQVEDVIAILAVISNPLDDQALLGALASPACAVLPDTLWLLRRIAGGGRLWYALSDVTSEAEEDEEEDEEKARWTAAIPDVDVERLRRFRERIEALRDQPALLGLEGLIERCCEDSGYDLATLMRDRGAARWANVRKLMRLAREFERNEGPDLAGFLAYAEAETSREREAEAATAAEEHDGVRILTVHNAKGLEYDVVAVADLGRGLLAGGYRPNIRIGAAASEPEPAGSADAVGDEDTDEGPAPLRVGLQLARLGNQAEKIYEYDPLGELAEREESEEALRLAYVAATRARRRLLLSGVFNPNRKADAEIKPGTPVTDRLVAAWRESGGLGDLLGAGESGEAKVQVDPPQPRPGLEAVAGPSEIAVTVSLPDAGAGARLEQRASAPEDDAPIEPSSPPLLPAVPPGVLASARLSYSAISAYERCGYRFYVERVLGVEQPEPRPDPERGDDEGERERETGELPPPGEPATRAERFGFGNAIHTLLEQSARGGWELPDRNGCAAALQAEGLAATDSELDRATAMLEGWLGSPLCESLRSAGASVHPETAFVLPFGETLIRGSIDLLAEADGEPPLVLDYKTDALRGGSPGDQIGRYRVQRAIYALAAARARNGGGPVTIRSAYVFLERPDEPVEETFGPEELAEAQAEIERLLAGIADGRFVVTASPHKALCHDCPARERLCSYGPELTLREEAEALA